MAHTLKLFALDIIKGLLLICVAFGLTLFLVEQNQVNELIDKYILFVSLIVGLLTLERAYFYIRYYKYVVMPYALKLISQPKSEDKNIKVFVDRFVKYDKANNTLYYKNKNAINPKLYLEKKDEILHFLNLYHNKNIEIEIIPHKTKWVKIKIYQLPMNFGFDIGYLKFGYVYHGHSQNGAYYTHLTDLTHTITVGESGSGKSNLMNLQIYSLLHNIAFIEHLYFVDLKGVELSRYQIPRFTTFIDNLSDVEKLFEDLKQTMYERFKIMQQRGDILFDGCPIFVILDEVGTIGTAHDKKLRDSIFNNMIELFQKGRACKIILLLYAQKIDSTNIPSNVLANIQTKILMKTDSDFNINNSIGLKEDIEQITRLKVSDFPKGRAIIKDGITSERTLIQVPYVPKEQQASLIQYFQRLIK